MAWLVEVMLECYRDMFLFFWKPILNAITKKVAAKLEILVLAEPSDVEKNKSAFAIKLDVDADTFERAWAVVARRHPDLFPMLIESEDCQLMAKAIDTLIDSPKRLVTKAGVAKLSGLSLERVSELWPMIGNGRSVWLMSYSSSQAYFEDFPKPSYLR